MPPLGLFPILFVSFPLLLWLVDGARSSRGAFAVGWCFGFGFFVAGLYWISNALLVEADRFAWLIPFAACGLPALLAVFTGRSEEHTSELQSLMRISYAVFCLKKK